MSEMNANKSVIQIEKNNQDDMDCEIINESKQNDMVQKTFASTLIGKNVMKLNKCHATIGKYCDEMISTSYRHGESNKWWGVGSKNDQITFTYCLSLPY